MPTWLGIDIGATSVKAALMRSNYRKLALVRLVTAEVEASPGAETAAAPQIAQAVRAAFMRVLEGEKQGADAIAVAIEGSRAAIHRIELPATAQKQLADVLAYELEAQVPFDMEGAVFDWRLLPPAGGAAEAGAQLPVVAAVARVDDVRARIDLLKESIAQEPERVGVGAFSLASLVPYVAAVADSECVAILDLGARASEVLVLERGEPVFARTLSTGTKGLPASAERLARDIRVSLSAHRAQGGAAPTRVFLCGGGAFVSGAEGFLSGSLELPVQVLPEPALDAEDVPADELRQQPLYAKAIALSLSLAGRGAGLNLRRGPLAYERGFAWVRERIPMLAGLAAVILVSFVFSTWARLHAVHKERDALEAALGQVTKDVLGTEATTAQDAQDLLAKEKALTDEDPMPHADAFDVMIMLSQAVPSTMTHDVEELDVQKSHVTIRGIVGSTADAQSITSNLADNRCLANVNLKSTNQAIGSERQKYVLEADLRCPEDQKTAPKKKEAQGGASATASASGGSK